MSTQECESCGIHLIISITGETVDDGDGGYDVRCLNCGAINVAKDNLAFDNSDEPPPGPDFDSDDAHTRRAWDVDDQ